VVKRTQESVATARRERKPARVIQEKFKEEREEAINSRPLVPMNPKQKEYIHLINTYDLVLATGWAGTSKTYIPTVMACDAYLRGDIDKIVFTRPNVSNSRSLGMFKGSAIEKMEMWLMPVMNILRDRLGVGGLETAIKNGNIQFVPMEVVKGFSAENCFFIVDEGEDLSVDEAKKIVTRQGRNCKMIISGDISQSELKEKSGLALLFKMIERHPQLNVGTVDFNHINDIVRSEQCKQWIVAFNKDEKEAKANE
jgi:phosphate starvation-inducible PhoH-like protein